LTKTKRIVDIVQYGEKRKKLEPNETVSGI